MELSREILEEGQQPSTPAQPEVTAPEQSVEETPAQPSGEPTITPYTDTEVQTILDADGKLDRNRLTPSQQIVQKSFEKHYQKRYQEVAEERRQLRQQPQQAPVNVFEAFDRNPPQIMGELSALIAAEKQKDPFSEKTIKLEVLRDNLYARGLQNQRQESISTRAMSETVDAVRTTIPDFDSKLPKLEEFAREELGYTSDYLARMTDPATQGPESVFMFVRSINKMYDKANVGKNIKNKEVKAKPNQLERPGGTATDDTQETDPGKWSYEKYKAAVNSGKLK